MGKDQQWQTPAARRPVVRPRCGFEVASNESL